MRITKEQMWPRQESQGPSNMHMRCLRTQKTKATKEMRRLRVYYKWPFGGSGTVPLIMLQGEWLRNSGFDIGDEVLVTVEKNRLTIDFEKRKED